MVRSSTFRSIALSFPDSTESEHHGHPDFRVRGKVFASLSADECRGVLKLALPVQTRLVKAQPDAFSLNGWSKQGWTNVHLTAVTRKDLANLIEGSWRAVAPPLLVDAYDEGEL